MAFNQQGRLSEIGRVFYVSMMDGTRKAYLVGPYAEHQDALEALEPAREYVNNHFADAAFYSFGTCGMDVSDGRTPPQGKLNAILEIEIPAIA